MSDRLPPMSNDGFDPLEARLADLADAVAFPPTPDLAGAVAMRLRTESPGAAMEPRRLVQRSMRRSLLLAAALVLVVVGGAVAVRLGLELLDIRFGPVPTLSPPTTQPGASPAQSVELGGSLQLGERVTLKDVLQLSSMRVLVPDTLGPPDLVYVGGKALRGQVAFVYAPREGLPSSGLLGGAALLITQARGEMDDGLASKLLDAGLATVDRVDVDGAPGVWISGKPHMFWYLAPDGTFIEESRRFVGDTLAWERDGVLYRIEGDITLERALDIARSMR